MAALAIVGVFLGLMPLTEAHRQQKLQVEGWNIDDALALNAEELLNDPIDDFVPFVDQSGKETNANSAFENDFLLNPIPEKAQPSATVSKKDFRFAQQKPSNPSSSNEYNVRPQTNFRFQQIQDKQTQRVRANVSKSRESLDDLDTPSDNGALKTALDTIHNLGTVLDRVETGTPEMQMDGVLKGVKETESLIRNATEAKSSGTQAVRAFDSVDSTTAVDKVPESKKQPISPPVLSTQPVFRSQSMVTLKAQMDQLSKSLKQDIELRDETQDKLNEILKHVDAAIHHNRHSPNLDTEDEYATKLDKILSKLDSLTKSLNLSPPPPAPSLMPPDSNPPPSRQSLPPPPLLGHHGPERQH
ncbi:hypothetical protein AAMO2058_000935200 [Amorphochlora amoebiformis]